MHGASRFLSRISSHLDTRARDFRCSRCQGGPASKEHTAECIGHLRSAVAPLAPSMAGLSIYGRRKPDDGETASPAPPLTQRCVFSHC